MIMVYLLMYKSEATEKIKEYISYIETKFQKTPKRIKSDRGGEYNNSGLQH